jgi:hypothetical protein
MLISQVTISVENRGQRREVWFLFASDHADIEDLHGALVEDGSVFGYRIDTVPSGQSVRRETGRYQFVIHRDAIVTICPPQCQLEVAA